MSQQRLNDAEAAGTAIAKAFVDNFEARNRSPTAAELAVLEDEASRHFAAQAAPWAEQHLIGIWREAMTNHLAARLKEFRRAARTGSAPLHQSPPEAPRASPQRGWGPPFTIGGSGTTR